MAHSRAGSLPSWIEVNCMGSAAVGKAARFIGKMLLFRLVIAERQVEFAQLDKFHLQSGKASNSKLVWKQLKKEKTNKQTNKTVLQDHPS